MIWEAPRTSADATGSSSSPGCTAPPARISSAPEGGEEQRVAVGHYVFIPGGDRHASGGDAKEGALFYDESMGKFDINAVE
jgi:hypothetical protein